MRLIVTVIDLPRAESADVLVEGSADATVDALARELGRRPVPPVLYVDGRPVDPRMTLADAPIRDGTVVSLDDPAGCVPPEPAGVVGRRRGRCTACSRRR